MKKSTSRNESPTGTMDNTIYRFFWQWMALSIVALILAMALPARSADVFVDEGSADAPSQAAGPETLAPASEVAAKEMANELADTKKDEMKSDLKDANKDASMKAAESGKEMALEDESLPVTDKKTTTAANEATQKEIAKKEKKKSKKKKKSVAKSESKKSKSIAKSKSSKKPGKFAKVDKKKSKKVTKAEKKKGKKVAGQSVNKKGSNRKVASEDVTKFFGGQYKTVKKECAIVTKPGSQDSIGSTHPDKKVWVEKARDGYWKVYDKDGEAGYVRRKCFN